MPNTINNPGRLHPKIKCINPDTGLLEPFFFKWLVSLWERTGGFDDYIAIGEISNVEITNTSFASDIQTEFESIEKALAVSSDSRIATLQDQIDDVQREAALNQIVTWNIDDFQLLTTAVNYTTTGKQIITVTSNVTITLNANPLDKELAIIKRLTTAGTVTISAGAKTIDGLGTYDLIVNYEGVECMYSYPNDTWIIV